MPEKAEKGIRDYKAKLALWPALLHLQKNTFVSSVVAGDHRLQGAIRAIQKRMLKWDKSTPTDDDSRSFFGKLAEKLPTKSDISGELLISMSVLEFAQCLPEEHHKLAQLTLKKFGITFSPVHATHLNPSNENCYPIWIYDTSPPEPISRGVKKRQIDQKHYYMDPDSAEAWNTFVGGANAYGLYLECLASLRHLVAHPDCKNIMQQQKPNTVVMLAGGGAPTKDLVVLQSLLEDRDSNERLHYFLMDVSCYMLEHSRQAILQNARVLDLMDKFSIELIKSDVLEMTPDHRLQLREADGPVLFAITGGTIGNLNEAAFFSSLRCVSAVGDLLIISADTCDKSPAARAALCAKYDNKDLRHFIRPVVRAVVNEAKPHMTVDDALERVKIFSLEGDKSRSEVPGSLTAIAVLDIGSPITLFTSTRYDSEKLIDYADRRGWQFICQAESPDHPDSHFRQFLFIRKKQE